MSQVPTIAVILPVYNGERFVADAVQSILRQTFGDFELIIVDDGSTDSTPQILAKLSGSRVRVITLAEHRGIAHALNTGIRDSRSEFIARMDADDVSLPRRLERQVAFLRTHPNVGICGTLAREFGDQSRLRPVPLDPPSIRARLFFGWAMDHPTLMLRRAILDQHDLAYRDEFLHAEDLDLLMRAAEITDLANVAEVLLRYRMHPGSVTSTFHAEQIDALSRLVRRQLRALIPEPSSEDEDLHVRIALNRISRAELSRAEHWLERLRDANQRTQRYSPRSFERELRMRWFFLHRYGTLRGTGALVSYWKSPFSRRADIGWQQCWSLTVRSLLR